MQSAEMVARAALRSVSSKARSVELYDALAPTGSASIVPDGPVGVPEVPHAFRLFIARVNAMVTDTCVADTAAMPGPSAGVGAGVGVLGEGLGEVLGVDEGEVRGVDVGEPLGVALDAGASVRGEAVGAGVDGRADGRPRVPGGAALEHAASSRTSPSGRIRIIARGPRRAPAGSGRSASAARR
jgi:hypothetical protein